MESRSFSKGIRGKFGLGVKVMKSQLGIVMFGFANGKEEFCVYILLWDIWIPASQVFLSQGGIDILIGLIADNAQGIGDRSDVRKPIIIVAPCDTPDEWFHSLLVDRTNNV